MVDGSMNLLKSPEINRSDGGNLRRFSMGKAISLSIDEQSSSGERRSSTGSCHDFCKYGHKHSLETKARVPLPKRAMKKSLDGQNLDQVVVVSEKEKQFIRPTKLKASPSSGTCITGVTDVVNRVVPINSPSRRSPVETEKSLDGHNLDQVVAVPEKEKQSVRATQLKASPSSGTCITGVTDVVNRVVPINSPSRQSPVEIEKSLDGHNLDQVVAVPEKEKQSIRATQLKASPSSGTCITGGTKLVNRVIPINSPSTRSPVETEKSLAGHNLDQVVAVPEKEKQSVCATQLKASSSSGTCISGGTDMVNRVVPINSPSRRSPVETEKSLDGHNLDQVVVVPKKEKRSVRATKLKASPSSGTCITSGTDVVNQVVRINYPSRRSPVETEVMSESKEQVMLVKSPSRRSPIKIEVTSESKELVVPVNTPSRRSPVETDVMTESSERVLLVNSPSRQSPIKIEVTSEGKELAVPVNSPSRQSPVEIEVTSESKELGVPENSPSGRGRVEIEVTSEHKELVVPESSPSRRSPIKSEVMNESKKLVAKTKTMPKTQNPKIHKTTTQVVYSATKSESSPKQALTNIGEAGADSLSKPKASKAKSVTTSGSFGNIAVHKNNSSKSGEGVATSKGNGTKVVGNSIVTSDPNSVDAVGNLPAIKNKNSKVFSRVISQNKTRRAQPKEAPSVEPQEKTLYVINMETKQTKLVESDQNEKHSLKGYPKSPPPPYKPSSLANAPSLSPHKENRCGTKSTRSEANATFSGPKKPSGIKKEDDHNVVKKGRSPRMLQTKGKDSSSLNLSFRNRKVVDLHSESHGPTRLKFMRGKSPGDNQKSKDSHKTSLKKGIVKVISKNSTQPSEKVVLRHQDVQGKKDSQVLSNNVIAETARKLVRIRKSKVKALVGAFEKVISLQDKSAFCKIHSLN